MCGPDATHLLHVLCNIMFYYMADLTTVQSHNYEDNAEVYYFKNFYSFVKSHSVITSYRL